MHNPDFIYGEKNVASLHEYYRKLGRYIGCSENRNFLPAQIIAFFRGLGLRNSTTHFNPAKFLNPLYPDTLCFADKLVEEKLRQRLVPSLPIIDTLCHLCGKIWNDHEVLYFTGEAWVCYRDLTEAQRDPLAGILSVNGGGGNDGRVAFYNAVLAWGLGEVPRHQLFAHGASELQSFGLSSVLTLKQQLDWVRPLIHSHFLKSGVDEVARRLVCELEKQGPKRRLKRAHQCFPFPSKVARAEASRPENMSENLVGALNDQERSTLLRWKERFSQREPAFSSENLMCLLALELGISIIHLTRLRRYFNWSCIFHEKNTDSWWMKVPMRHANVGGLSYYVINLSDHPAVLRLLQKWWGQYSRKYKNTDSIALLKRSWFKRESNSGLLIKAFRIFLGDTDSNKNSGINFGMLRRLSSSKAIGLHPGAFCGATDRQFEMGLNYVAIQDVLRCGLQVEPDLVSIAGTMVFEPFSAPADGNQKARLLFKFLEGVEFKKNRGRPFRQLFASKDVSIFKQVSIILAKIDHQPEEHLYKKPAAALLKQLNRPTTSAALIANQLYKNAIVAGSLRASKPLPLYAEKYLSRVFSEIRSKADESPDPFERELCVFIHILLIFGLRLGEAILLRGVDVLIQPDNISVYIPSGKTENARRSVSATITCPFDSLTPVAWEYLKCRREQIANSKEETIWPLLTERYRHLKTVRNAKTNKTKVVPTWKKNTITKLIERKFTSLGLKMTPHILRHHTAFYALQRGIKKHYLTGNFETFVCSLSDQLGHGSLLVTLNEYIGTAMAAWSPFRLDAPAPSSPGASPASGVVLSGECPDFKAGS